MARRRRRTSVVLPARGRALTLALPQYGGRLGPGDLRLEVRLLDGGARVDADHAQRVVPGAREAVRRLHGGDHDVSCGGPGLDDEHLGVGVDVQRPACPRSYLVTKIAIGALAGLMPAVRASRLPPTVALRTV